MAENSIHEADETAQAPTFRLDIANAIYDYTLVVYEYKNAVAAWEVCYNTTGDKATESAAYDALNTAENKQEEAADALAIWIENEIDAAYRAGREGR